MCVNVVVIICMYYVGERKPTGKKITTNKNPKSMKHRMFPSLVTFMNDFVCILFKHFNWIDAHLFEYIYIKKNVFYAIPNLLCALYIHASGRSHQRHDL